MSSTVDMWTDAGLITESQNLIWNPTRVVLRLIYDKQHENESDLNNYKTSYSHNGAEFSNLVNVSQRPSRGSCNGETSKYFVSL